MRTNDRINTSPRYLRLAFFTWIVLVILIDLGYIYQKFRH